MGKEYPGPHDATDGVCDCDYWTSSATNRLVHEHWAKVGQGRIDRSEWMSILITLIVGAVIAAASFGAGWTVNDWRRDSQENDELNNAIEAAGVAREFSNIVSDRFEKKLANLKITNTTINKEVIREVEKAVYVDPQCDLPVSGVQLRNTAIEAANRAAAGESPAAVPTAGKDARTADSAGGSPSGGR